ncbi:MAG: prephenate dehydratase [Planctomycetes bacterium]|jgi:chorismate mutase/prephenate dehydratase|nr:prephenate dehydratase [Planctomycetota bacterium]
MPSETDPPDSAAAPLSPEQVEADLAPLRQRIDQLDQQLVELLNERAKVVVEVGKVKRQVPGAGKIYAPERERRVLEQVRKHNHGPLPDSCLEGIWRELMSGSFALERPLRIGYLGPPGSFSHLAAKAKFGSSVEYDALAGIHAVFEEIVRGHIDYGLVPIENTNIGGVTETLDAFLNSPVAVCAELLINIHHNLLSNVPLAQVKRIYSKPEALGQCRAWLNQQAEKIEIVAAASTSKAAEHAANEADAAAIGSTLAAEVYGLQVQFANIEDNPNNTTRFFIIGTQKSRPTGEDKTSIMFTTEHKAGALTNVLDVFRDFGINMTHIDKRPSKRVNWEYIFFVDLLGHVEDENLAAALTEAGEHCLRLTVLGSYPRAAEVL